MKHYRRQCESDVVLSAAVIIPPVGGHLRHTDQARGFTQCGALFEMCVQRL